MTAAVVLTQADTDRAALAERGPAGWFALRGDLTGELLTWQGRVIVHRDAGELAFLVPAGATVVPAPLGAAGYLPISAHPDMATIRWPINRQEFRR